MLPSLPLYLFIFFFNDPPPPEIYTLSLHDALPISLGGARAAAVKPIRLRAQELKLRAYEVGTVKLRVTKAQRRRIRRARRATLVTSLTAKRSEEHTSELQSLAYLVCRLLLEKKNIK